MIAMSGFHESKNPSMESRNELSAIYVPPPMNFLMSGFMSERCVLTMSS